MRGGCAPRPTSPPPSRRPAARGTASRRTRLSPQSLLLLYLLAGAMIVNLTWRIRAIRRIWYPRGYQIVHVGHYLHAISWPIHDHERSGTAGSTKVFGIMENRRMFHDPEGFLVRAD